MKKKQSSRLICHLNTINTVVTFYVYILFLFVQQLLLCRHTTSIYIAWCIVCSADNLIPARMRTNLCLYYLNTRLLRGNNPCQDYLFVYRLPHLFQLPNRGRARRGRTHQAEAETQNCEWAPPQDLGVTRNTLAPAPVIAYPRGLDSGPAGRSEKWVFYRGVRRPRAPSAARLRGGADPELLVKVAVCVRPGRWELRQH